MSRTASQDELLRVCVQDLHAARRTAADRLPGVTRHAGTELAEKLGRLGADFADEAERFEASGLSLDGPDNIWMAGVMDDAERDTRSIEPGPLLDIALIGALRKGIMADAVSLETALELAQVLGQQELAASLQEMRERAGSSDAAMAALLRDIV
ncbi:DUF892 family protein [Croceibacterium aestuarii]|uniref:DUF892 family protein n=1 Tax=Croceibacterium aestuarii TaxID=3064139 RepID=UPI00272E5F79|nr:DUF892 family protein [Croceibacterium sp. D39]